MCSKSSAGICGINFKLFAKEKPSCCSAIHSQADMEKFCRLVVHLDVLAFVHCTIRLRQLTTKWSLYDQTPFAYKFLKPQIHNTIHADRISQWIFLLGTVSPFLSELFPKLYCFGLKQSCGHERTVFEFLWALVTLWWRGFVRSASHSCRFLTLKRYHSRPDCLIGSMARWCC